MKSTRTARRSLNAFATVALWCALTASGSSAPQTQAGDITVDDPRPLAVAIEQLEMRHGWVVTYEDPPYEFVADIRDVTTAVRKDVGDASRPSVLVPNGGSFAFSYPVGNAPGAPDPGTVLPALLSSYHLSGNPGMFRLLRSGTIFHVIPSMSNNALGALEGRPSRLDVRISVEERERSALDMLQAILQAVSRSIGTDVFVGTVPLNLLIQTQIREGASNETARAVLMRTFAATGRSLSWQLFCQPGTTMCALNVHFVNGPNG